MNILIPIDFSEISKNAVDFAYSLFKNQACHVYLLYVIDGIEKSKKVYAEIDKKENQSNRFYKSKLQETIQLFQLKHTPTQLKSHAITKAGRVVDSIKEEVEEKKIDLIVMGTTGSNQNNKMVLGSNTTDVINKVKCATFLVPQNAVFKSIKNIALPTDYSIFLGTELLDLLIKFTSICNAQLHIFHLKRSQDKILGDQAEHKEFLKEFLTDTPSHFHTITNKNLDVAIQSCIDKYKINLIAMVANNIHFFQQLFFNDHKASNSYQTKIPILVVHI